MSDAKNLSLVPLENHVIVQAKQEEETVSKSGILLPESTNKEKPSKGVVLAVGP